MIKKRFSPWLYLFTGVLCIAWSGIFVKLAGVHGFTSAFYRFFLALLIITPLVVYHKAWKINKRSFATAFISGILFSFDLACWHLSLLRSQATISTLLANCAPLWVGLGSFFILHLKNGKQFWIGTAIALLGIPVLVGIQNVIHLKVDLGVTLALLASFFYGTYILISGHLRTKLSTLTFMFYSLIGSSFTSLIICIIAKSPLHGFTVHTWSYLWALALLPHVAGWLTINYALGFIKSNIASVSLLSQSIFTAIFAAFMLRESLVFHQIAGGLIILGGIYIVNYRKN
jgi:drug/metabolite transporter (DMT)-like permease